MKRLLKNIYEYGFVKLGLVWKIPLILVLVNLLSMVLNMSFYIVLKKLAFVKIGPVDFKVICKYLLTLDIYPAVLLISYIVIVLVFIRFIDRFKFEQVGLKCNTKSLVTLFRGILSAFLFVSMIFLIFNIIGIVDIKGMFKNNGNIIENFYAMVFPAILFGLAAISEELFTRGYMITSLKWINRFVAIFIPAIIFSVLHLDNIIDFNTEALIGLSNTFLIAVFLGWYFYYKKDLWFPIGFHFAWNFTMGSIYGMSVSNISLFKENSIFTSEIKGNSILTGGDYGPEGSIIVFIMELILVIAIFIVNRKKLIEIKD